MEEHVYPHMYKIENAHWWFVARQRIIMQYINARITTSPETTILDVGCGTGAVLELFSKRFRAYGLDFSRQAIDFCHQRGLVNLFHGSLASYPKSQHFDIITMLDVVEHIDDDDGLLRDAYALLKPGGYLLIAVPAFPSLWSAHDVVLHHKRRYTKRRLQQIVESESFEIEHLTFFNMLLFPVAVMKRWLTKLTNSDKANDLEIPGRIINGILKRVFELEADIVPRCSLPFGLSLLCLARKPAR